MKRNRDLLSLVLVLVSAALWCGRPHWEWDRVGHLRQCQANCKNLATALEMYASDNGGAYPPALEALAARYPRHLSEIPTCPTTSLDPYSTSYRVSSRPDGFSFGCTGFNHGLPPEFEGLHQQRRDFSRGYPWSDTDCGLIDHP